MKTNWKQTLAVRYFGLSKIPLILFIRPKVLTLDQDKCMLKVRLSRRTRNHLNSMYFGTLAIGADLASGLLAMEIIKKSNRRISLVFKDMQADFLKRVDSDAVFRCKDGRKIEALIEKVLKTGERHHEAIKIEVTAPDKYGDEILAVFSLTLSLKEKVSPNRVDSDSSKKIESA